MVEIKIYANRPMGPTWRNLVKMAGAISEKYEGVKCETISKGFMMIGVGNDSPKPPNVVVNGKVLGGKLTAEELEASVKEFLTV